MLAQPRSALLSLLALTTACTGGKGEDTDTDLGESSSSSSTVSSTSSSTGAASDSDPEPTGDDGFATCKVPEVRDDVDFVFEHATLAEFVDLDLDCTVDGTSVGGEGGVSAAIDLTCVDESDVSHTVRIALKLFHDATLAFTAGDEVTLVYRVNQDIGDYREWLSLRGQGDALKLFAVRGYSVFTAEAAPLWDPLGFAPVAQALCISEDLGECHVERRTALDVTVDGSTQRVFDREWATLASGITVHLGNAREVDRYPNPGCIGDSVDGLEIRMIVVGEQ